MRGPKWLVADDPHPAYSGWGRRDIPKVTVRMDEFPRLYSEPVPAPKTEKRVLDIPRDEGRAGFIASTVVLVAVVALLVWTVAGLLIGGIA